MSSLGDLIKQDGMEVNKTGQAYCKQELNWPLYFAVSSSVETSQQINITSEI